MDAIKCIETCRKLIELCRLIQRQWQLMKHFIIWIRFKSTKQYTKTRGPIRLMEKTEWRRVDDWELRPVACVLGTKTYLRSDQNWLRYGVLVELGAPNLSSFIWLTSDRVPGCWPSLVSQAAGLVEATSITHANHVYIMFQHDSKLFLSMSLNE